MNRRTKIVATLGPVSEDKEDIRKLIAAGMNVARINFSHGTYEQAAKMVKNIRALEKETGQIVTIMQDLQGPKIRLCPLPDDVIVKKGEVITFSTKKGKKDTLYIPNCSMLTKVLKKGDRLLIEDGLIRTKILSTKDCFVRAKVIVGGRIKSCKGVNIPDSTLPASATLTLKDRKDLKFGIEKLKVDAVAISFVQNRKDIERVRTAIEKMTKRPIKIIAKIEKKEALENLADIIDAADGVMVARGDLGIEIKAELVPIAQKRIVAMARKEGKPVIIATQILQSMVENPIPTRAEMSDAAEAVFEHADAFMLSNESAVGQYPVKAVQTLARVAKVIEHEIFKTKELFPIPVPSEETEDESMALNACKVADDIDAAAIVVVTKDGYTARMVLKHRPKTPVIVVTQSKDQAHVLNMLWGIKAIVVDNARRSEEIKTLLKKKKLIKAKDKAVYIKLSDSKRSFVVF